MHDTPKHVRDLQRNLLMQQAPEVRLAMASAMFESARALMLASLPTGQSTADRVDALLLRTYGEELSKETRLAIRQRVATAQHLPPMPPGA
jgi:hypothetical protein